jgi:hypothetical protein
MKKWISLVLAILCVTSLMAKQSVLIDFNKLKANGNGSDPSQSIKLDDPKMLDYQDHDKANRNQHMPTLLDYSSIAGSNFTEEEVKAMNTSLAAYNWDVVLNSSASTTQNKAFSKAIEWHTKYVPVLKDETDGVSDNPEGYTIMGVRIHFPETPFNCWALIQPPFEIPAYEDILTDELGNEISDEATLKKGRGDKFINGFGVVRNVGIIKTIDIRVYGCQFKNSISVILKDDMGVETEYHMPQYLDFDGWRKITWKNPNYIEDASNRDLYIVPLYPRNQPFVKLKGFRIYRQGDQWGGDFVTYIKDVNITYDQAVLERPNQPIDHEDAWGILRDRTEAAKEREMSRIGHTQILRYLETQKMHSSSN